MAASSGIERFFAAGSSRGNSSPTSTNNNNVTDKSAVHPNGRSRRPVDPSVTMHPAISYKEVRR